MTKPSLQSFLSLGLLKGFAGETKFGVIKRANFSLQSSHLEMDGKIYHDEWAADRTGGGQELVKVDGETYTRVYAGGTISLVALKQLGITKKDILKFLITSLNTAGAQTRLHENFGPILEGDWSYRYAVIEQNDSIPMTTGREDIRYKGNIVFTHVFIMCPIE